MHARARNGERGIEELGRWLSRARTHHEQAHARIDDDRDRSRVRACVRARARWGSSTLLLLNTLSVGDLGRAYPFIRCTISVE